MLKVLNLCFLGFSSRISTVQEIFSIVCVTLLFFIKIKYFPTKCNFSLNRYTNWQILAFLCIVTRLSTYFLLLWGLINVATTLTFDDWKIISITSNAGDVASSIFAPISADKWTLLSEQKWYSQFRRRSLQASSSCWTQTREARPFGSWCSRQVCVALGLHWRLVCTDRRASLQALCRITASWFL